MFNLIDTELGVKADLVPLTREPRWRAAFARRVLDLQVVDSNVPALRRYSAGLALGTVALNRRGPLKSCEKYPQLAHRTQGSHRPR